MWNPFKKKEDSKKICALCSCDYGIVLVHLISNLNSSTLFKFQVQHAQLLSNISLEQASLQIVSLINEWGLSGANCVCVLPPADYRLLLLEAPKVPQSELKQAVKWLVNDLINFPLDQAGIDVFPAPVRAGQPPKIYVAVTKLDYIRKLVNVVESSGLKIACIDIADLALVRLLAALPQSLAGVSYLLLDGNIARLLIAKNGILYLERNLNTNPLSIGQNQQTQYDSLILEIQRSLDFYQNQFAQQAPAKLFLSPSLNEKIDLKESLKTGVSVNAEVLELNQLVQFNDQDSPEHTDFYMMAIGALINHLS